MAGTFYGADVAQLRSLAARAGSGAGSLGSLQRRLGAEIAGSAYWQGHDAGAFRSEWDRVHAQSLARAVAGLQQMQRELAAHADQQESASAAASAPATSGGALSGGAAPSSAPPSTAPVGAPPSVLLTPAALSALTPHQVGRWWAGLDAAGRADFLRLYPYAAGNTDGLPVDTRIEANRVAAGTRLAELEREGKGSTEEAHYLRKTVKGDIRLAAYDPAKGNLIQMIGHYDSSTTTVLTYVPGTFATAGDFYAGSAQKMAAYLQQSDPTGRTAAFVYKNSEFPQDGTFRQSADKAFGEAAGRKLAAFEAGLADQNPSGARTVAVSHSWGEAAVASSEMYGAHYDRQISLSGAWMPEGWTADPGTAYDHFAYDFDALATAQGLGLVGDKYPLADPAFTKHIYDDPARNIVLGPVKITTDPMAKIENHSLIANAQDARNRAAREDVAKVIFGGRR